MRNSNKFIPRDYKDSIPGEKIIRRSPSSGFYEVQECDYFYTRNPSKVDEFGNKLIQRSTTRYSDPDIVLKCIPEARIVDKHLIVTQNNNILFGLQYHYLTLPNSKNLQEIFELDHLLKVEKLRYTFVKDICPI